MRKSSLPHSYLQHIPRFRSYRWFHPHEYQSGSYVENADEFPEKMNLQICRKIDTGNLDIEIWERGSGYTKASGTGSCAAAMTAYKLGLTENRVNVNQPGGMIQIDIHEDGTIYMTGSVGYVADMSVAEGFFS